MKELRHTILTLGLCTLLGMSTLSTADPGGTSVADVEQSVTDTIDGRAAATRDRLIDDAVDAVQKSREALKALDNNDIDAALEDMAIAIGKLELAIARYPGLALAPVGFSIRTHDLDATKASVMTTIDEAKRLLDDGKVQLARQLLADLGSEVTISTTSLPLAGYREALKAVTPLIDDGKLDAAKMKLQAALNTVVITREILPLPLIRAQAMLNIAEALADQPELTQEQEKVLSKSIAAVREQIELAELLGYGEKKDFRHTFRELKKIEKKLESNEPLAGFFDKTRDAISGLWHS